MNGIAIVGMAGRFPGAQDIEAFWRNICTGTESVSTFSPDDIAPALFESPSTVSDPNYIRSKAVLDNAAMFDAAFFGFNPKEAEILDPQHRLFLECCWEVLETAGCNPEAFAGSIGVFAGSHMNTYLMANLLRHPQAAADAGVLQVTLGNDKDYLATRVSYKLGLRGPGITVQTACSTSLVAVCLACQSLMTYQCDAALAGGVSVVFPQRSGRLYQRGSVFSRDGHCRAFDANADGTVAGEGVGVVALKRVEDAVEGRDHIYAVIRGFAMNNDGAAKVGYTAPGIEGQSEVISTAIAMADVSAETITYVEAHGTGTPVGDPIEVAALTEAFRADTSRTQFCAIGSLKTNIGHMGPAAGVGGLIKAALCIDRGRIPPSLHFHSPNPAIDFASSPFFVNTSLREWDARPRRAGVSSFGIGGTNAHVVLEEAPAAERLAASRKVHILTLSARTPGALEAATRRLTDHLSGSRDGLSLCDVAFTLQSRKAFPLRRVILAADTASALADPERQLTGSASPSARPVAFLFPGGGSQYPGMGRELYEEEPVFRREVDACLKLLPASLAAHVRDSLLCARTEAASQTAAMTRPSIALSALFSLEYALAKLFENWGIVPAAMIGHSLGEYTAACLSGVLSLEDALRLVSLRGRLLDGLPAGSMLSVPMSETDIAAMLPRELTIAVINSPALVVVSGPEAAIDSFSQMLASRGVEARRLRIAAAGHSPAIDPILEEFRDGARTLDYRAPRIPFVSNQTGRWFGDAQRSADYWVSHLRQPVRFADGLRTLLDNSDFVFLEVGPGQTLSTLARTQLPPARSASVVSAMRHPSEERPDADCLAAALGRLWVSGVTVNWRALDGGCGRIVPLPAYPFERQKYWIDAGPGTMETGAPIPEQPPVSEPAGYSRPALATAYTAPRNDAEERIAAIWRGLLGIKDIGVFDNFLELGGHSLLGTQVLSRVRTEFGVELPLARLFAKPTIAALAELVVKSGTVSSAPIVPASQGSAELLDRIALMSDAEIDALLAKTMKQKELNS